MADQIESTVRLLLLSGGIDSAALAVALRPERALFIDYGQRPATAERAASGAIAKQLGIPHHNLTADFREIGAGVLSGGKPAGGSPSPEWWPFRNQLLVTCAGAWAVKHREEIFAADCPIELIVGSVGPDGERHSDGKPEFYAALDALLSVQEGRISVRAPGLDFDTPGLMKWSQIDDAVLGWTHSCHRSNTPCADCPGCFKREAVLDQLGRLR